MDAETSKTSAHDLDAVRRRRAELRESIGQLEEALAAPATHRAVIWGERVYRALQAIADDFAEHVTVTEGPDGLHHDIQTAAPRLVRAVDALALEHEVLATEIAVLVNDSAPPVADDDVVPLRENATSLLTSLIRHRQRGADLVYEAFEQDLGAGD